MCNTFSLWFRGWQIIFLFEVCFGISRGWWQRQKLFSGSHPDFFSWRIRFPFSDSSLSVEVFFCSVVHIFDCFNMNSIKFAFFSAFSDISRLDKSPLLANGYNAPPTHLNHMPFMQMGHHVAPMMSPGMPPHIRPDGGMLKNHQNMPGMEAITRSVQSELVLFFHFD